MKYTLKFLLLAVIPFFAVSALADDTNELALIPEPQKVQQLDGTFTLTPQTAIYADRDSRKTAELLAERLRKSTCYPLKVHWKMLSAVPQDAILLTTKKANAQLGAEGYDLTVATNGVVIRAPAQAGLFYGGQTLLQLFPPEIFSTNLAKVPIITLPLGLNQPKIFYTNAAAVTWPAPCVQIEDWPRFQWRGLMLDVSRHFSNKSEVEALLDEMSLYKLNRFHWHLVDDQGWRIQIKKYPKLTEVGAWRDKCDFEPPDGKVHGQYQWEKPSPDKFGPDGRYGGFYTQKDIREVVAYAAARHIMIVPEIEMPGHSLAALTAYPEYCCPGIKLGLSGNLRTRSGIYDPSNEGIYPFLDNILAEVFQLFPGPYVHVGGDEVEKKYWHNNPACQALMKREGLANEDELQTYFEKRMETFIDAHHKTLIGWSEILKGGLGTNAVVMDWIGGGKQAAEASHDAIMTTESYYYLDHYQSTNHVIEPHCFGGYTPLKAVYTYNPIPDDLSPQDQSHILGVQANLWAEYVMSFPKVQYMVFPRECALAETGWSAWDAHNWDDFQRRILADEKRLDELGVNYRPGVSEPIDEAKAHW
jgi:hexosaminidase